MYIRSESCNKISFAVWFGELIRFEKNTCLINVALILQTRLQKMLPFFCSTFLSVRASIENNTQYMGRQKFGCFIFLLMLAQHENLYIYNYIDVHLLSIVLSYLVSQ